LRASKPQLLLLLLLLPLPWPHHTHMHMLTAHSPCNLPLHATQGPVLVCILDGWGVNLEDEYNAVFSAHTPCTDALRATPRRYRSVRAHGTAVGLPSDADMGNSEVGHNALGSGQVIDQVRRERGGVAGVGVVVVVLLHPSASQLLVVAATQQLCSTAGACLCPTQRRHTQRRRCRTHPHCPSWSSFLPLPASP
jgi:hypothetical protein